MNNRTSSRTAATSTLTAATNDRLRAAEARIAATWTVVRAAQRRIDQNPRPSRRTLGPGLVRHA